MRQKSLVTFTSFMKAVGLKAWIPLEHLVYHSEKQYACSDYYLTSRTFMRRWKSANRRCWFQFRSATAGRVQKAFRDQACRWFL